MTTTSFNRETHCLPEYCQVLKFKDASGQVKEMVFPKGLDLDRPKRPRTTFSEDQLQLLETEFQKNHYLIGKERTRLAGKLGLSETQIKVWFQNRRTKTKRDCVGLKPLLENSIEICNSDEATSPTSGRRSNSPSMQTHLRAEQKPNSSPTTESIADASADLSPLTSQMFGSQPTMPFDFLSVYREIFSRMQQQGAFLPHLLPHASSSAFLLPAGGFPFHYNLANFSPVKQQDSEEFKQ